MHCEVKTDFFVRKKGFKESTKLMLLYKYDLVLEWK